MSGRRCYAEKEKMLHTNRDRKEGAPGQDWNTGGEERAARPLPGRGGHRCESTGKDWSKREVRAPAKCYENKDKAPKHQVKKTMLHVDRSGKEGASGRDQSSKKEPVTRKSTDEGSERQH